MLVLALTAALIALPLGVWQLFALVRRGRLVTNGQIFSWVGVLIAVSYLSFTHDFAHSRARDLGLLLLVGLVSAAIGFLVNFSLPSARVLTLDGIAYPLAATYVLFYVVVVSAACTWVWPPPTGRSAA